MTRSAPHITRGRELDASDSLPAHTETGGIPDPPRADHGRALRIGLNALYWLPNEMGGTQTYLLRLVEALRRVAPQHDYVLFLNAAAAEYRAPEFAGLEVEESPFAGRTRALRVVWEHTRLGARARRRGLHLVHSLGYIGPASPGVPAIVTVHDLVHYRYPRQIATSKQLVWRWLFPRSLARAAHVITVSETVRSELIARYPFVESRATAIPQGVSTTWAARRDARSSSLYILAVASPAPHKNLETAIRAFALLAPGMPDLTLQLVGMRTEGTRRLVDLGAGLGLSDRIRFTGRIDDAQLASLYSGAAALVFPSLYEGFGLPVLEAMAAGCPVAAADRPILRETAGDAALFFSAEDDVALSEVLRRLIVDRALAARLVERGWTRAREFTWDRTAEHTLSVYARVASGARSRA